jgi:XRE family aerobic/anaerobic benzoate catabolism transcriptional regulator
MPLPDRTLPPERRRLNAPLSHAQQESAYLSQLGERVRAWRNGHGMTRKALAAASGVSERYLAQLEAGQGNISVLLLRKVAHAMNVAVESLVCESADQDPSRRRIALVGLRGAGKSTLGARLAGALGLPFVELDREVEHEAGAKLGEVFAMYGQEAFRRFERRALERVLRTHEAAVIAAGGGVVTDPDTYRLLLDNCHTVWLKAKAEEHMNRVIAQGDMRPFAGKMQGQGRPAALEEIRQLLADRDRLYSRADLTIETSGRSLKSSFDELRTKVRT